MAASTPAYSVHEDVVTAHGAPSTRIIAIAVDSSSHAEHAFDWAIKNIVRAETDQIVLLNVRPVVSVPLAYIDLSKELEKLESASKEESHNLLRKLAAKLPANKYNIRAIAMCGDPRDEIAFKVGEIKADMLVIGSRGLGAVSRSLLGSVSDYLVHHLNIPVIVPRE
ncbi:hypothetical protein HDU83_002559 [Entophlyctis luteolus]|nr:hypothetical protein HDU82_008863 [Entophlyctis luteolus]KAJ3346915.1 hypothetical protein HDU83_002559 [Entophlyctis luteolus]KAJ3386028.1 hypothetical protein HDU84_001857 [Entophlyctis sp. JEL0112]